MFPLLGIQASTLWERMGYIIHHASSVGVGRCHCHDFEFLDLGHAGFLTMFCFTSSDAVLHNLWKCLVNYVQRFNYNLKGGEPIAVTSTNSDSIATEELLNENKSFPFYKDHRSDKIKNVIRSKSCFDLVWTSFTMFCFTSGNVEQSQIILMTAMFMSMCQLLSFRPSTALSSNACDAIGPCVV